MQIVLWNCRGLGNPKKAEAMKDILRMEPRYILLLQETKIEEEVLLLLSKSKWKIIMAWLSVQGALQGALQLYGLRKSFC